MSAAAIIRPQHQRIRRAGRRVLGVLDVLPGGYSGPGDGGGGETGPIGDQNYISFNQSDVNAWYASPYGTVKATDLAQASSQGQFNNLEPPSVYQGEQAYTSSQATVAAGAGKGLYIDPDTVVPGAGGGGSSGSGAPSASSGTIIAPTIVPTATSTQAVSQTSSALSNLTSLLAQPITASIPWLTWGWALLIALGFVVVMRKR